ncbi:hypothetical protein NPIL_362511 [Nephila pilipes]|uniref:Uncharacterized protein n=1 Tax=Nephila pilipes TaxID=299642 RepID=A0A8X6TQR2_NEPPI|nr:hypothetical protein NPIL_362511 [Nephila pilipes]
MNQLNEGHENGRGVPLHVSSLISEEGGPPSALDPSDFYSRPVMTLLVSMTLFGTQGVDIRLSSSAFFAVRGKREHLEPELGAG